LSSVVKPLLFNLENYYCQYPRYRLPNHLFQLVFINKTFTILMVILHLPFNLHYTTPYNVSVKN